MVKALKYFGVWLLIQIVVAIVFIVPAAIIMLGLESTMDFGYDVGKTWLLALCMILINLVIIYVFWKRRYSNLSFLWSEKAKRLYFWVIIASIGYIMADWNLEELLPFADWESEDLELLNQLVGNPIGIITASIVAPVVEEVVFRGAILRALLQKKWSPWIAIVISAAIFGIIHLNLTQGVSAFVVGIFMGWLFYRTRSIWPGVILHMMNNTISSLWSYLPENTFSSIPLSPTGYLLLFVPVGLFLLVIGIQKINLMADSVDLSIPFLDRDDMKALQYAQATQGYYMPPVDAPVVVGAPIEPMDDSIEDSTTGDTPPEHNYQ